MDAIQHWLAKMGTHSDIKNQYKPMKKMLHAAKLNFASANHTTRPLRIEELIKILNLLDTSAIDDCVIHAVWTFAYSSGLRVHEFLAQKNSNVSELRKKFYLRRDRIFIWEPSNNSTKDKHFAIITYFHSKNNQEFFPQVVTIPCFCSQDICAVKSISRLLKLMKSKHPATAIFTWANGTYVTSSQSRLQLKNALSTIGSNPAFVGNHSMRKLLITEGIRQGIPDSILVQLFDWKSFHSSRPYINLQPQDLVKVRQDYIDGIRGNIIDQNQRFKLFTQKSKFKK